MADPVPPKKAELPLDVTLEGFQNAIANEEDLGVVFAGLTISTDLQKNLIVLKTGTAPEEHIELRFLAANDEAGAQAEADLLNNSLGAGANVETFGQVSIQNILRWVVAIRAVPASAASADLIAKIVKIAADSSIASHSWKGQGVAPIGYIKGMALVYARVYGKLLSGGNAAVKEMSKANTGFSRDALTFYAPQFSQANLKNDLAGDATLRHLFLILIGLGMPESSGKYNDGVDPNAKNPTADSAEAGLFQTSWDAVASVAATGAQTASGLMTDLFNEYKAKPSSGFLEVFKEGVPDITIKNVGTGTGADFQQLSKICPAFTAEFTAVGLRNIGAGKAANGDWQGHWGTIRDGLVDFQPDCDTLLKQVQDAVDAAGITDI